MQIKEISLCTKAISLSMVSHIYKIINSFTFVINPADECIYHKFIGSKYIFLVLYVDDILVATNDLN